MKAADLSEEPRGCQFGDERLSKRVSKIADALIAFDRGGVALGIVGQKS